MKTATLFLLLTGCAFAQTPCDVIVSDDAHIFRDVDAVEREANELVHSGADVRVRTVTAMYTPTLERYEKNMESSCPSWQAPDGGRKNNLVVFMMALSNRKTGIYYGSQWKSALDAQWPRIMSQAMNPRFRDRDFSGGFSAGLQEAARVIEAQAHMPLNAPAVIVQNPASPPTDLSGLWIFLGWLLGVVALGFIVWRALQWRGERAVEQEARRGAQQRALLTQQTVVSLLEKLGGKIQSYSIIATDKDKVERVTALINSASSNYSALKQSSVGDPDQANLTAAQYDAITASYKAMLKDLDEAESIMAGRQAKSYDVHDNSAAWSHLSGSAPKKKKAKTPPAAAAPNAPSAAPGSTVYQGGNTVIFADTSSSYRRDPEPSPSSSTPARSPDSGSGGGSSDWGSSSSDSGGGSRDFGSSGDSGGGGGDSSW